MFNNYKKHTSHKLLLLMKSSDWVDGQKQQNPSWKIYYDILQQTLAWGSTFAASGADLASCEVALGNSLGRPSIFVFLQDCKCEQITILRCTPSCTQYSLCQNFSSARKTKGKLMKSRELFGVMLVYMVLFHTLYYIQYYKYDILCLWFEIPQAICKEYDSVTPACSIEGRTVDGRSCTGKQ